jgi:hypothetical protein
MSEPIQSTEDRIFTAIKRFLMEFVIEPEYPDYNSDRIVQAYTNYIPQDGDNNFITMTIYDDEQNIIINKAVTVKDDEGNYFKHTYIRTDYSMIVEVYGDKAVSISSSFRSKFNEGKDSTDWFLRNYQCVPTEKMKRNNSTDILDQKAYAGKYDLWFKLQAVELVITPVPKITQIKIQDYQIT